MKTQMHTFSLILFLIFINFSCSKDETPSNPQVEGEIIESSGGATTTDFESYSGDIGVVFDARAIARKGYKPTQVTININAMNGNFSQTVPIDEFSFLAQLKISLDGLSEAAKNELVSGVSISPEFKDEAGNIIFTGASSTVSFQSNPNPRIINAEALIETQVNQTLYLSEDTGYYIQRMNLDGSPNSGAWRHLTSSTYGNVITANQTNFNGNEPDRIFTFISVPGEFNTFLIRLKSTGQFLRVSNTSQFGGNVVHPAPNVSPTSDYNVAVGITRYRFKIEQAENDTYRIISVYYNLPINQVEGYGLSTASSVAGIAAETRLWRIVSTSVQWSITNIGTTFLEPILPRPETGFSFNSTLTNCGGGNLSQTVGANVTETRSRTIGWEETISVATSNTVNVSTTVDVGFEAGFFGVSGNYNLSVTAGYEHSWSSSTDTTNWNDTTDTTQETLFSERTVTVPSGSASLVYDVYQFYPNTKVNFVQRLRVEGIDRSSGLNLIGEEIRTQFVFSGFNGVISSVEPNSIVITLKGTMNLDKVIETESDVQDVPANCD